MEKRGEQEEEEVRTEGGRYDGKHGKTEKRGKLEEERPKGGVKERRK